MLESPVFDAEEVKPEVEESEKSVDVAELQRIWEKSIKNNLAVTAERLTREIPGFNKDQAKKVIAELESKGVIKLRKGRYLDPDGKPILVYNVVTDRAPFTETAKQPEDVQPEKNEKRYEYDQDHRAAETELKRLDEARASILALDAATASSDQEITSLLSKKREELPAKAPQQLASLQERLRDSLNKAIELREACREELLKAKDSETLRKRFGEAFVASFSRDLEVIDAELMKLRERLKEAPKTLNIVNVSEPEEVREPSKIKGKIVGFFKKLFGAKEAKPAARTSERLERSYQLAADVNMQLDQAIEDFEVTGRSEDRDNLLRALNLEPRLIGKDEAATKRFYANALVNKIIELRKDGRNLAKADLLKKIAGQLDQSALRKLQSF